MTDEILAEQLAYYRARAGEYDDWFYRRGRYDWGAELNAKWFAEADLVRLALRALGPVETALELACGTGIWTEEVAQVAREVTALDGSPEVLEINRLRLAMAERRSPTRRADALAERAGSETGAPLITHRQADLFAWEPDREFDLVVFCFWLSHVPEERLDAFLDMVRRATRPGGRVFLLDSRNESTSMAKNHDRPTVETGVRVRKLNDGREYRVVKRFHEPEALTERFRQHGFEADLRTTPSYFLYGVGTRQ